MNKLVTMVLVIFLSLFLMTAQAGDGQSEPEATCPQTAESTTSDDATTQGGYCCVKYGSACCDCKCAIAIMSGDGDKGESQD